MMNLDADENILEGYQELEQKRSAVKQGYFRGK